MPGERSDVESGGGETRREPARSGTDDASDAQTESGGYVIVGLGNPGVRYERTPHNMGFLVLDRLAERNGIRIAAKEGGALAGAGAIASHEVVLAKPQTFMNLSGESVRAVLRSRARTGRSLILVYDEIDLPWRSLRIKTKGSAGGHNGVKSVIAAVGTDEFTRVRIGIRPDHDVEDIAQYVLAPMERALREDLDEMLTYTTEAIESIVAEGAVKAMTKFNRRAQGLIDEEE